MLHECCMRCIFDRMVALSICTPPGSVGGSTSSRVAGPRSLFSRAHASLQAKQRHRQNDGLKNSTYRTRPGRQVSSQFAMARELWARLQLSSSNASTHGRLASSSSSNTPFVSRRSSMRRTGSTQSNARHAAVSRTRQCACAPRSVRRLHAFKSLRATRISRARFSTGKAKTPGN